MGWPDQGPSRQVQIRLLFHDGGRMEVLGSGSHSQLRGGSAASKSRIYVGLRNLLELLLVNSDDEVESALNGLLVSGVCEGIAPLAIMGFGITSLAAQHHSTCHVWQIANRR